MSTKYDLRLCGDGDATVTLPWNRPEGDWHLRADVDLLVTPDGHVLLLDPVAMHYSRCHSLPASVQDRARAFARMIWLDVAEMVESDPSAAVLRAANEPEQV